MKHLIAPVLFLLVLAACGKEKAKAETVASDAAVVAAPKADEAIAAKLAAAYPRIRCALAAGINATETLYSDAGFADAAAYFHAFDVQAKANPKWAQTVTAQALAKPCVEPAAPTPTAAPAAPAEAGGTP